MLTADLFPRIANPIPSAPARRRTLLVAGFCLSALLAGCNDKATQQGAGAAPTPPEVSVVTLHPQSVAVTADMAGRTSASLSADVRPQVNGIIKERLFQEGGEVKAGDVLYRIDPASYQAALDSAAAALQRAQAAVPAAQANLERSQTLARTQAVSQQTLEGYQTTLSQAQADVLSAQAALQTAKINLGYTEIRAPIGGRIDKSNLTPGALVTADQTTALTTIRTLDPINVDLTQSSTNLLNFRRAIAEGRLKFSGEGVAVHLTLDDGRNYGQAGKMAFVESYVDQTTGTFPLRAQFPNPDRLLLPGMYVRAQVQEGVAPNSFLVPQRGVTRDAKGNATALLVGGDGKVSQASLAVRRSVGTNWLVDSGVKDGDRVVVEGSQFARVGQQATPVEVTIDEATGEVRQRDDASAQHAASPGGQTTAPAASANAVRAD